MTRIHDIAVLGSNPAAYAAAYFLARKKCNVVVVAAPSAPVECPLIDWIPKELLRLPQLPKGLITKAKTTAFKTVVYHSNKLDKRADMVSRGVAGYFVRAADLAQALRREAHKSGASSVILKERPSLELAEDHVTVVNAPVAARLLINVNSNPTDALAALSQPGRTAPQSSLTVVALDVPVGRKGGGPLKPGVMHVVEQPERSELGMFYQAGTTVHMRIISTSKASGNRAIELSTMVRSLQAAGLINALALNKAKGAVWYPPAGAALEMETHVAKRCLLAGTAGGFADSITGQTLAPTIQSALLACQAALDALKTPKTQEALMHFKTSWRQHLANSLRPPSTSLQMLLPLLFVNKRILPKFTRTLLRGESI